MADRPQGNYHATFGTLSMCMSAALIAGGQRRAAAPAYAVIAEQGGPYIWGTVFAVIGIAILLTSDRTLLLTWFLLAGGFCYAMLAAAFLWSAIIFPTANFTAMVAYTWIAVMHVCASRRLEDKWRKQICSDKD